MVHAGFAPDFCLKTTPTSRHTFYVLWPNLVQHTDREILGGNQQMYLCREMLNHLFNLVFRDLLLEEGAVTLDESSESHGETNGETDWAAGAIHAQVPLEGICIEDPRLGPGLLLLVLLFLWRLDYLLLLR